MSHLKNIFSNTIPKTGQKPSVPCAPITYDSVNQLVLATIGWLLILNSILCIFDAQDLNVTVVVVWNRIQQFLRLTKDLSYADCALSRFQLFSTTSSFATSTRRRKIRRKHHGTSCELNYHLEHDKNTTSLTKNQCIFRGFRFQLYMFVWCSVRKKSSSSLLWQYSIKCSGMCPFRGAGGPIWWQLEGFPPLYLQATLQLTGASTGADMIWWSTIHLCRSCILYNLAMVYIHVCTSVSLLLSWHTFSVSQFSSAYLLAWISVTHVLPAE